MLQEAALVKARNLIENGYTDTATISEYMAVTDPKTHITRHEEKVVLENQPCRLSFPKQNVVAAKNSDTATKVERTVELFLSPETVIKPGSKITVKRENISTEYAQSGQPAIYPTHQEIMLELFRGWA